MNQRKEIHNRVLQASSKAELDAAYQEWANDYDRDLLDEMGYVAPTLAAQVLQTYVPDKSAQILDAGCGTGLVGEALHQAGYTHLDGLDYSAAMLQKAQEKNVYQQVIQADLTAPLALADQRYKAIISVGTFTCGHVGPEAFAELIRITQRGGHICFTVREAAWDEEDYRTQLAALEQQGRWALQESRRMDYVQKEGASCQVCVYQVTDK